MVDGKCKFDCICTFIKKVLEPDTFDEHGFFFLVKLRNTKVGTFMNWLSMEDAFRPPINKYTKENKKAVHKWLGK